MHQRVGRKKFVKINILTESLSRLFTSNIYILNIDEKLRRSYGEGHRGIIADRQMPGARVVFAAPKAKTQLQDDELDK